MHSLLERTQINTNVNIMILSPCLVQVIRTDFSPQDWSDRDARYTICIEAAIDDSACPTGLELAPWS